MQAMTVPAGATAGQDRFTNDTERQDTMTTSTATQEYDTGSPLYRTTHTTPTDYWNDSCSTRELAYAIRNGAVGATTNPSIVLNVLKKEFSDWKDTLLGIISGNPTWPED